MRINPLENEWAGIMRADPRQAQAPCTFLAKNRQTAESPRDFAGRAQTGMHPG
jgi:hypothetical protein